MRYRNLSASGDYVFGKRNPQFLADSPQCVAQAVLTKLKLWESEWFLDTSEGTPYTQRILGYNATPGDRDQAIKERILSTPNVKEIVSYQSSFDGNARSMSVSVTLSTNFGLVDLVIPFP